MRIWPSVNFQACSHSNLIRVKFRLQAILLKQKLPLICTWTRNYEYSIVLCIEQWLLRLACFLQGPGPVGILTLCVCVCAHARACARVYSVMSKLFLTPWTVVHLQSPLSMRFPGKNTGVGFHFLLRGIFLTKGLNLSLQRLLPWQVDGIGRWISPVSHLRRPVWHEFFKPEKFPQLPKVLSTLLNYHLSGFPPGDSVVCFMDCWKNYACKECSMLSCCHAVFPVW